MGRSHKRNHQNEVVILLQSTQISETAGAVCNEEVCQCPARWMSSTTDGGLRAGREGATLCTSFWRRAVRNNRCRQAWLRCVEHAQCI